MANKRGMATGVEVARISVKVSPDTKLFRRELKRQLEDIERTTKAKVGVDTDTKAAEKKVNKAAEKMSSNKVNLKADSSSIDKAIAQMQGKLDKLDLNWDKKVMKFRLDRFQPQSEFAQIRSESNRIIQEFEIAYDRARRSMTDLEVSLRPELSRFDPRVINARLRQLFGRKPVEIPVEASGGNGGDKHMAALVAAGGKGGGLLSKLAPNFGTGVNPAGYAAILAGIMLVAAPLVGLVTTALLTLPGLVGLITAPIAAVTLGLDGFKKAAESIKPQFEELKTIMSDEAFKSFEPVMARIADTIFPKLKEALPSVTKGLANLAQGALDAFQGDGGVKFQNSITRIGQALNAMRPGMDGFMSGFIGLIDQFTLKLPAITEWFNKTGQDFDRWVQKISESGELSTAFDNLGKTIKTVLDWLGQLASHSIDFMGQEGAVDGFNATLKKVGDTIQGIIDLSAELNEKWQGLVQIGRFFNGITDVMQGDGSGALNNFKDLFTNKPWNGAKQEVDNLNLSVKQTAAEAEASQQKLESMLSGQASGGVSGGNPMDVLKSNLTAGAEAPIVQPPDMEPAKAELTEYQSFVDSVTQQVRGSLEQATSGQSLPAPNFDEFKAAWQELPNVANRAMQSVTESVTAGGQEAAGAAMAAGMQILEAIRGVAPMFQSVGLQMMAGLAAGIQAGSASAISAAVSAATSALNAAKNALGIKSPSRKFMEVGDYSMQGLAKGMENGFAPVLAEARDMAAKIADAFANGGDPTASIAGYSGKEVSRMEKALGFEGKKLSVQARALDYQAKMAGKGALADSLKARADELRMQKDGIDLQKDMLALTREYGQEVEGVGENPMAKAAEDLFNMPVDFATKAGGQFLSDLGISGNGALSTIGKTALDWGSQFIFNVSNIDEAMSVQRNQQNKQALSFGG